MSQKVEDNSQPDLEETAPHRVPMMDGWSMWRWACVRGAGFAAARVLRLAAPKTAELGDALIRAEDEARAAAVAGLERELTPMRGKPRARTLKWIARLRREVDALPDLDAGAASTETIQALALARRE